VQRITQETRTAGARIISAKGATYYGIGAALVRIVRAILRDEHTVFTVSSLVPESLHLGSVSLSLPTIINRGGIDRVLHEGKRSPSPLLMPEKCWRVHWIAGRPIVYSLPHASFATAFSGYYLAL